MLADAPLNAGLWASNLLLLGVKQRTSKNNKENSKMSMKSALIVTALFALTAHEGAGQTYSAGGAGNGSCGTWMADRRTPDGVSAMLDAQWILGFLSGIGFLGKVNGLDPLRGVDAQAVLAWVDNWCRNRPLSSIADAGAAFKNAHPN